MKQIIYTFLLVIIMNTQYAYAVEKINWGYKHLSGNVIFNLPQGVEAYLNSKKEGVQFKIDTSINPMYIRADINGDGKQEYIILIKNLRDNMRGFLIYFNSDKVDILFAGMKPVKTMKSSKKQVSYSKELPKSFDMWSIYSGSIDVLPGSIPMPPRIGDTVMIGKSESWMSMFYWNGKEYIIYHLGG